MVILGVAVAAVAAFAASSVYYSIATPLERTALGDAAIDRGRPVVWKVIAELARTAAVAAAFTWIASWQRSGQDHWGVPEALALAFVAWVAFPVVLLTGSVMWEQVAPVTAAMHAGDWLLKLALIAFAVGLLH